MSADRKCPDPARVARLMEGDLPESDMDAICDHVSKCPACTTILRKLSHASTLLDSISQDANSWTTDADDRFAIDELIARLQGLSLHTALHVGAAPPGLSREGNTSSIGASASERGSVVDLDELAKALLRPPEADGEEMGWLESYRVLRVLGAGGMGVVFEAEDLRLGRRVAIKAMLPSLLGRKEHELRFLREARAAASIEHDNIVPIHHVGEDRGVPFFVMPLLKGESLESRLRREGKLSVPDTVRIGRQIAIGVAAAHERGLVHRDIKPANIWLEQRSDQFPRIRILDFGLARIEDDAAQLTKTGSVAGTPAYMAPEQARGDLADARSDLFSIGCVLYCLLTGKPPFTGRNSAAMMFAIIHQQPESLRDIQPDIPSRLASLVMQLLEKDPAQRVAKADDIAGALLSIADDGPDKNVGQTWQPATGKGTGFRAAPGGPVQSDESQGASRSRKVVVAVMTTLLVMGGLYSANRIGKDTKRGLPGATAAATARSAPIGDAPFPGLVPNPARIAGLRRWQMETFAPRGDIFAVAWAPDGRRIACGSPIGNVRIIDVETQKTLQIMPAHTGSVWAIDWSPVEDLIVTVGEDGAVRLFDSQGTLHRELGSHSGTVRSVAFSRDGSWIASGGFDSKIRLWRTTGETGPVLSGHSSQIDGIAWRPSGNKLASASLDGTVRIWNLEGSWNVNGIQGPELKGHLGGVLGLSWSADGELLASAGVDGTVLLWTSNGTKHGVLSGHGKIVTAISWSANGLIATSGDDKTIRLWQPDGTLLKTQPLEVGRINDLEWSRDGSRLAIATDCLGIRFLSETGDWEGAIPIDTTSARALSYSRTGELAAVGDGGMAGIWNADGTRKTELKGHAKNVYSVSWNPIGSELISGSWDTSVRIWNANGDTIAIRNGTNPAAWNPAGKEIAWTTGWDVQLASAGQLPLALRGHQAQVIRLGWNTTGSQLASSDLNGVIRLWNRDGSSAGVIQSDPMVLALAWHPREPLLAIGGAGNGKIQLWNTSGILVRTWTAHTKGIIALDWSPDGDRLLSSAYDQHVRAWNLEGNAAGTFPEPMAIGCAAAWNAAAEQIATSHIDGVICLWDGGTFEPKSTSVVFNDGNWARFDSTGISHASDLPAVDHRIVVVTEKDAGMVGMMSVSEFRERKSLSTR